jgi:hypothetical protein
MVLWVRLRERCPACADACECVAVGEGRTSAEVYVSFVAFILFLMMGIRACDSTARTSQCGSTFHPCHIVLLSMNVVVVYLFIKLIDKLPTLSVRRGGRIVPV